jgi:hypothetical protein
MGDFSRASAAEDAYDESSPPTGVPAYALVIGNREYRSLPILPKADNDAKVMASLLASFGIDVVVRVNVAHLDFTKEISELNKRAQIGHQYGVKPLVIFYFSGHGFIDDSGRQFMVGVDAGSGGEDIETGAVTVESAIDILSKEGIAVALIDACRFDLDNYVNPNRDQNLSSNTAERPAGAPVDITAPDADYLVGYANRRGEPVLGYVNINDNNSPYSEGLKRNLGNGHNVVFELSLVHNFVVRLKIDHDPRVDPHMTGDIYAQYPDSLRQKIEKEWTIIRQNPTESSVLDFIFRYRNGPFTEAATYWIKSHTSGENLP